MKKIRKTLVGFVLSDISRHANKACYTLFSLEENGTRRAAVDWDFSCFFYIFLNKEFVSFLLKMT